MPIVDASFIIVSKAALGRSLPVGILSLACPLSPKAAGGSEIQCQIASGIINV